MRRRNCCINTRNFMTRQLKLVILALDGLEYDYVTKFCYKQLQQDTFGKTDISAFELPRSVILWSSFLAGKNKEKELVATQDFWHASLPITETFFTAAKNPLAIDVPGFTYTHEQHDRERANMKEFFEGNTIRIEDYDKHVFAHHLKVKEQFFAALQEDKHDVIMAYFSVADVIGHLSFGITPKMRMIYQELDDIARTVKETYHGNVLIISDHGMFARGRFGDHTPYGFWSTNFPVSFTTPALTDFFKTLTALLTQKP